MGLISWLLSLLEPESGKKPAAPAPLPPAPPPPPRQWTARPGAAQPAPPAPPKGPGMSQRLDLAASPFAPISRKEMLKRGGSLAVRNDPFWGRRDLIPPVDSVRANLVDRGMVAGGFLTPEQLDEIHSVGAEMQPYLDDHVFQAAAGQKAVEELRQSREARKQAKRAEAAERRRKHAEAVAARRAIDITHLGRTVSHGLSDRRSNVEALKALELPFLSSPADVARALELTIPRLRWLAWDSEASPLCHYTLFTVPKKSGGVRTLAAPHATMARCQRWILENILSKVKVHAAAHGFVPRRSTCTNAAPHVGTAWVLNVDLKDFFPSITFHRVQGVFKELGYSPAVACILALLCTERPRCKATLHGKALYVGTGPRALPQGACTSPALANLVARRLDSRLAGLAETLRLNYTRYADDISFSPTVETPTGRDLVGYLLARLRHIVKDEGFRLHPDKTRLQRRNMAQVVTGIVVNDHPGVPRDVVRRMRAILHGARKTGLAAQNRENRENFEAWVHGMIAYISMVNPEQGKRLRAAAEGLPP